MKNVQYKIEKIFAHDGYYFIVLMCGADGHFPFQWVWDGAEYKTYERAEKAIAYMFNNTKEYGAKYS